MPINRKDIRRTWEVLTHAWTTLQVRRRALRPCSVPRDLDRGDASSGASRGVSVLQTNARLAELGAPDGTDPKDVSMRVAYDEALATVKAHPLFGQPPLTELQVR
jgi:hypothetical protein